MSEREVIDGKEVEKLVKAVKWRQRRLFLLRHEAEAPCWTSGN